MHIGRHKTGTTSIQHFLTHNREALQRYGVVYPEPRLKQHLYAHHDLALAMRAGEDMTPWRDWLKPLHRKDNAVLVSSEGFQFARPKIVRQLVAGFPFGAVVYIREQFGNAWSAHTQKVWGGRETRHFEEVLALYAPNYVNFLRRWAFVTKDNLDVRIFDRTKLQGGDVVSDFCSNVLKLNKTLFQSVPSVNESLGWRSINYLRQFNVEHGGDPHFAAMKRRVVLALRELGKDFPELMERPIFRPGLREAYQAQFIASNRAIAVEFLGSTKPLFDLTWYGDSLYDPQEGLSPRHLDALNQLCQQAA